MYVLVATPLSQALDDFDPEDVAGVIDDLRGFIRENSDAADASWNEEPNEELAAYGLEPFCMDTLRAVAAQLETSGSLEGFNGGQTPWDHPAIALLLEKEDGPEKFRLLFEEGHLSAYVPVDFDGVVTVSFDDEEDDEEDEEDHDHEEEVVVLSLSRLKAELELLREPLQVSEDMLSSFDDLSFDEDSDPAEVSLAAARYAWCIFMKVIDDAAKSNHPVVMFYEGEDDIDELEAELEAELDELH